LKSTTARLGLAVDNLLLARAHNVAHNVAAELEDLLRGVGGVIEPHPIEQQLHSFVAHLVRHRRHLQGAACGRQSSELDASELDAAILQGMEGGAAFEIEAQSMGPGYGLWSQLKRTTSRRTTWMRSWPGHGRAHNALAQPQTHDQ
jgi:hypothetical protein